MKNAGVYERQAVGSAGNLRRMNRVGPDSAVAVDFQRSILQFAAKNTE